MILEKFTIPTGYLFTGQYSKGKLETLSIGDYGKRHNVRAEFLGYYNEIQGVPNTYCMPLSEKWVVTVSTQYGCPMKCTFCDVPKVEFNGNATFEDLQQQLYNAILLFPQVQYTERLNLHFARMGEPILNDAVFSFSEWLASEGKRAIQRDTGLRIEVIHPVLTTSLPMRFTKLAARLHHWCKLKNNAFRGQAGLQFSINSTNAQQRHQMFGGQSLTLDSFAAIANELPEPLSRKYCLNFAFSTDYEIDASLLRELFDPARFMCKITPIHNNNACRENGIRTVGGYDSYAPYAKAEKDLIAAGFDVLVFVPSIDEENGLVTCGNAVLGGSKLKYEEGLIKIEGLHPWHEHIAH